MSLSIQRLRILVNGIMYHITYLINCFFNKVSRIEIKILEKVVVLSDANLLFLGWLKKRTRICKSQCQKLVDVIIVSQKICKANQTLQN